jgi:hypothetical protein
MAGIPVSVVGAMPDCSSASCGCGVIGNAERRQVMAVNHTVPRLEIDRFVPVTRSVEHDRDSAVDWLIPNSRFRAFSAPALIFRSWVTATRTSVGLGKRKRIVR